MKAMKMTVFMLDSQIAPWGQKSISILSLTVVCRVKGLGWIHLFGLVPATQPSGNSKDGRAKDMTGVEVTEFFLLHTFTYIF